MGDQTKVRELLRKEKEMFKLMVSFDAGLSYQQFMESEDSKELEERTKKEDINWTRWYIEQNGKPINEIICPIHKNIFETLIKLNS
jgi:hypothetical protein